MKIILSAFFVSAFNIYFLAGDISAQNLYLMKNSRNTLTTTLPSDSVRNLSSNNKPSFMMKKNPWKAVMFSAVLPGSGQFYNESYWKIPVIAGLGGYFVYELIKNNNRYLDYKSQYQNSQTQQNPSGDPYLLSLREFYRDQRDNFIIYSGILYVAQLVDAYVDAQLFDFNVSDNAHFSFLDKSSIAKLRIFF